MVRLIRLFCEYDDNGNGHKWVADYDGDGIYEEVIDTTIYEYNEDGQPISSYYDNFSDESSSMQYEYDNDGNLMFSSESIDYGNDGTVEEIRSYTYDEDGNVISIEYSEDWDSNGDFDYSQYSYEYDDGNVIFMGYSGGHQEDYNSEQWSESYDSNGNLIERSDSNGWG